MRTDPTNTLRELWRNEGGHGTSPSLDEIRRKTWTLSARVRRQDIVSYVACALGTAWIVVVLLRLNLDTTNTVGAILLGLGGLYLALERHVRARARVPNEELLQQALVAFHRRELLRQRDFLRWGALWYHSGLPLWPGMGVILVGGVLAGRIGWLWLVANAAAVAAMAISVALWNRREIQKLERGIDNLSAELEQDRS